MCSFQCTLFKQCVKCKRRGAVGLGLLTKFLLQHTSVEATGGKFVQLNAEGRSELGMESERFLWRRGFRL